MKLINIKHPEETATFKQALIQGLGKDRGLFFPEKLAPLAHIDELLRLPFIERSTKILHHLIGPEISTSDLHEIVQKAFNFPCPLVEITNGIYCLELFHGPSLAFKDFGARFMAQCLQYFNKRPITILTATSGDTGGAVAQALLGLKNVNVTILFPLGKISDIQKVLFSTLGDNVQAIAIKGDFDDCQALVKDAFEDNTLKKTIGLNSANSINIARLYAQVCYYFEAYAQLKVPCHICVPSGNFGNLTAALIAKELGLPIHHTIAATNENDTVVRYLKSHNWDPHPTVATLSNAMDVSRPSNWERIEEMLQRNPALKSDLFAYKISEEETVVGMKNLKKLDYISEPHAAVAYQAIIKDNSRKFPSIFLGTAHPVKFKESVDEILDTNIELPTLVKEHLKRTCLAKTIDNDYEELKKLLIEQNLNR